MEAGRERVTYSTYLAVAPDMAPATGYSHLRHPICLEGFLPDDGATDQ